MESNIQYIMYGTLVRYDWYAKWKSNPDNFVISEKEIGFITHVFNGRDGEFIIIGEILLKFNDDNTGFISIPEINDEHQNYIKNKVNKLYNLDGVFHYFYIKEFTND